MRIAHGEGDAPFQSFVLGKARCCRNERRAVVDAKRTAIEVGAAGQRAHHGARAAADFEHARAGRQLQAFGVLVEEPREDFVLRPALEPRNQPFDRRVF